MTGWGRAGGSSTRIGLWRGRSERIYPEASLMEGTKGGCISLVYIIENVQHQPSTIVNCCNRKK